MSLRALVEIAREASQPHPDSTRRVKARLRARFRLGDEAGHLLQQLPRPSREAMKRVQRRLRTGETAPVRRFGFG
ncbi:MAG: hypothetical protein ACFB9M_02500 [Myxococcota bacterium]